MDDLRASPLLAQKTILVTGAGDGIGREAALTYARHGAQVILLGRTRQKLSTVQAEIAQLNQQPAELYVLDLNTLTEAQCHELVEWLSLRVTALHGLLHNAGLLGQIAPFIKQSPAEWRAVMQVNVTAGFMLTQALLPMLLAATPYASLLFTSSSVGRTGRADWGAYSVSKFATEGLMQVLADEYRGTSLRVNAINPGGTRTGMRAHAFPQEDPLTLRTPADIMPLYLYLMSDESHTCNGQSFDAQPGKKAGTQQ